MFTVYARNINAFPGEQNPPVGEVELFRIPNQDNTKRPFLSMSVSNELGNAGSFEFSVDPESKFADIWRHMRTIVRVEYDGDTIFFGRVLTIDRDMFRSRKVHCEGAYTFFMDSVFEGKSKGYKVLTGAYLQMLIDAHNNCMNDTPEKKIYLGEVPGNYSVNISEEQKLPNEEQKYGATKGYKTVKDWLDELTSNYGGFYRVRYNLNDDKLYLDWMKTYFNKDVNDQTLSVSSNAVDLSDTVEVDNIFTHIVATGKGWNYADGTSGGDQKHKIEVIADAGQGSAEGCLVFSSFSEAKPETVVGLGYHPARYYSFKNWTVNSGDVTIDTETNSFVMGSKDVSITGRFTKEGGWDPDDAHMIFITVTPQGAGNAYPSLPKMKSGNEVRLYAQPFTGYNFGYWTVASGGITISNNRFTMPDNDVKIVAHFRLQPVAI